jgi:hypothetical protein
VPRRYVSAKLASPTKFPTLRGSSPSSHWRSIVTCGTIAKSMFTLRSPVVTLNPQYSLSSDHMKVSNSRTGDERRMTADFPGMTRSLPFAGLPGASDLVKEARSTRESVSQSREAPSRSRRSRTQGDTAVSLADDRNWTPRGSCEITMSNSGGAVKAYT